MYMYYGCALLFDIHVGWFDIDQEHNTNVYVSNIHDDTTDEEFLELMTKCGIIMKDEQGEFLKVCIRIIKI